MNGHREEHLDVDKIAEWAHQRDGVIERVATEKKWRVIPYDEVARRLQERKKS